MARKHVSQLKPGDRLTEDVRTPLGGVLFQKHRSVTANDLDIFRAFKIEAVEIDSSEDVEDEDIQETEQVQEAAIEPEISTFDKQYSKMLRILKQVFASLNGGASIPMMDLRQTLEGLLQHIHEYDILTFSPKNENAEDYLYHSSIKVALTAYQLAKWNKMEHRELIQVAMSGLFHDIGNIKVDHNILNKPSKLNINEIEEMKKHTIMGYNMLKHVAGINEGVKLCALQHHEKVDGSGYPLGITGDQIHIYAKIIAVADIYHAMTSKRGHKDARSPYLVLEQIFNESFGKLDPKLVQVFINKVTQFHNGTLVRLNDGTIGEIVFADREHPTRPWVNISSKVINLALHRNLYIEAVILR